MATPHSTPLTPEQIAGLEAGGGILRGQDPATQRAYLLIEQIKPTIDDGYVREKLQEGVAAIEAGEISDWNVDEFKDELRQRHAARKPKT